MARNERIIKTLNYISKMYINAFDDISDELMYLGNFDLNLQFIDDLMVLIKVDKKIHAQRQTIKKIYDAYPNFEDDCKVLYDRLILIHKAIFKLMQNEYGVSSCWENEKGELEYLRI